MTPHPINPVQWQQAQGVARQTCARFFRDGGTAADAMSAFGLDASDVSFSDWNRAVDRIAETLCQTPMRRAA